jgi:hypothetical protein
MKAGSKERPIPESIEGPAEGPEKAGPRTGWVGERPLAIFLWAMVFMVVISILILSCVPPVSRDALIHHLAIPKLYLKHGGMYEIPQIPFSYYPMNVDLLYLIPLYLGFDIASKWIHFAFALMTGVLIFNYLRRAAGLAWAIFAVLFFLSIPIIVKLSITAYVDLGLVFFSTASLLLLLRWLHGGGAACLILSGLIPFVVLSVFLPYLSSKSPSGERVPLARVVYGTGVFVLVALLVFSPWMIRNYLWTENPIYPLYDRWFNGPGTDTGFSMGTFAFRSIVHGESWWEIVLLPVRIFFQGEDGNPRYFDGRLNPFLLLFPWMALFSGLRLSATLRRELKILGFYCALVLLITLFSSEMRVRYIAPIIPPLVILATFGLKGVFERVASWEASALRIAGSGVLLLSVGAAFVCNGVYLFRQFRIVDPFSYLGGTLTRDAYIEKYRPEYPVMVFANRNLPPDARILFVFLGERGYYCDRDYLFDMRGGRSTLQGLVKGDGGSEGLSRGLRELGITHLLIHLTIFDRWARESFGREEMRVLQWFFRERAEMVYMHKDYGLFAIR